jgi:colanic acid/amylovoran biosynthesis protein
MWGQNADLVGPDRFLVGLIKNKIVQLLKKKNVMLAASPGPFSTELLPLVKEVLSGFDLITTRESISKKILSEYNIDVSNVYEYACPSFLFQEKSENPPKHINKITQIGKDKLKIGFILCGWNMPEAPFSKWPRNDKEYKNFAELIIHLLKRYSCQVYFLSHSNGFIKEPNFKLIHGRDFPILKQLYSIIQDDIKSDDLFLLDGIYSPIVTKEIIGEFDIVISGRIHGAIAAVSHYIPTVIIDYGHEPKAHKLLGFASLIGIEDYLINPHSIENMKQVAERCIEKRSVIKNHLERRIPEIKKLSQSGFDILKSIYQ